MYAPGPLEAEKNLSQAMEKVHSYELDLEALNKAHPIEKIQPIRKKETNRDRSPLKELSLEKIPSSKLKKWEN